MTAQQQYFVKIGLAKLSPKSKELANSFWGSLHPTSISNEQLEVLGKNMLGMFHLVSMAPESDNTMSGIIAKLAKKSLFTSEHKNNSPMVGQALQSAIATTLHDDWESPVFSALRVASDEILKTVNQE